MDRQVDELHGLLEIWRTRSEIPRITAVSYSALTAMLETLVVQDSALMWSRIGRTASIPCQRDQRVPTRSASRGRSGRCLRSHGDHNIGGLDCLSGELWLFRPDVDLFFQHRCNGGWVNRLSRRRAWNASSCPAKCQYPAAIWDRPALWMQTNNTDALGLTRDSLTRW